MNKTILAGLIILSFLFAASFSYASVDNAYEVAVINLKGDVQVDPQADGNWIKPWIGMKLKKESLIKTGQDSYVEVVFDAEGSNVLRIKQETLIAVQNARVDLKNGSVLAAFANLTDGSTFSVKTPTAVCGIRGSGMGVDYINNLTVASAFEHSVYVQGLDSNGNPVGQEVVIPEGWEIRVLQNGITEPPAELSENEKKIFEAWVEFITGTGSGSGDDGDGDDDPDNKDLDEIKKDKEEEPEISPSGSSGSSHNLEMSPGYEG